MLKSRPCSHSIREERVADSAIMPAREIAHDVNSRNRYAGRRVGLGQARCLADTVADMRMSKVEVQGYRGSAAQPIEVEIPGRFALLIGANAVGKTTLSDGLYMVHGNHFPRLPRPSSANLGDPAAHPRSRPNGRRWQWRSGMRGGCCPHSAHAGWPGSRSSPRQRKDESTVPRFTSSGCNSVLLSSSSSSTQTPCAVTAPLSRVFIHTS
jgi:hypothetical protein